MRFGPTVRFISATAVLLFAWANPVLADLYRWVDPETGSVKFSSYLPPWFGDAPKERRAPKVEVIPAARSAPAFEPRLDADRDTAAAPDAVDRPYLELAESLQALEQLNTKSKPSNPEEDAARLEEKWQFGVPLEARRLALMQQVAGLRPPPPGAAPEAVGAAWRTTQQLIVALEKTNDALTSLDPRKLNARHFEMRALTDKVAALWEPFAEALAGRADRGR